MVATIGPGQAFMLDAGTFLVSATAIFLMRYRPAPRGGARGANLDARDLREGRVRRAHTWLLATLLAAAVFLLAYWGPWRCSSPTACGTSRRGRQRLRAGACVRRHGAIGRFPAWFPRRHITFMYSYWASGSAVFVVARRCGRQVISLLEGGSSPAAWSSGNAVQTLVPTEILGRVTSLDWFVSTSLVPVSFALTGPVSPGSASRRRSSSPVLAAAGVTFIFLLVPASATPRATTASRRSARA